MKRLLLRIRRRTSSPLYRIIQLIKGTYTIPEADRMLKYDYIGMFEYMILTRKVRREGQQNFFIWLLTGYVLIGFLWMLLEWLLYGEVQHRTVDDYISLAWLLFVWRAYKRGLKIGAKNIDTK